MIKRLSSAIQKDIEREVFKASYFQEQIEALLLQIADLEEKAIVHEATAREIASSELGPNLVDAAIEMAKLSIPYMKEKLNDHVTGSQIRSPKPLEDEASSDLSNQGVSRVDENSQTPDKKEQTVALEEGQDDFDEDEFFGVEVPPSRIEEARDIVAEAISAVRKNSKNNIYASGRGKNAWRKHLFSAAWTHFANNDSATDDQEEHPDRSDTVPDDQSTEGVQSVISGVEVSVSDENTLSDFDLEGATADFVSDDTSDETETLSEIENLPIMDEAADEQSTSSEISVDDGENDDYHFSVSDDDAVIHEDDVPVDDDFSFDEDVTVDDDFPFNEDSAPVDDNVTFSIEDTFFQADAPVHEPLEEDAPSASSTVSSPHQEAIKSEHGGVSVNVQAAPVSPTPQSDPRHGALTAEQAAEQADYISRRAVQRPPGLMNRSVPNPGVSSSSQKPDDVSSSGGKPLSAVQRPSVPSRPAPPLAPTQRKPGYGNVVAEAPSGLEEAIEQRRAAEKAEVKTQTSSKPVLPPAPSIPPSARPPQLTRPTVVAPPREEKPQQNSSGSAPSRSVPMPFNRPKFNSTQR